MSATTCSGPGDGPDGRCQRPVEALGLCHAHYRQHNRQRPLAPIRSRDPGMKLPGITVSQVCGEALTEAGPTPYRAARDVLETWARQPKQPNEDGPPT